MNLDDIELAFSPAQKFCQPVRKIGGMETRDPRRGWKDIFAKQAGHVVSAAAQCLGGVVHDICNSAFRLARRQRGNRYPHLCGVPLSRGYRIVKNEIVVHIQID
jgi:hypothetical protein